MLEKIKKVRYPYSKKNSFEIWRFEEEQMKRRLSSTDPLLKKALFLFIFSLFLQIPLMFIKGIVNERETLYSETNYSIGKEWGKYQEIAGPFLVIPYDDGYVEISYDDNGKRIEQKKYKENYYIVLPDKLETKAVLKDEVRKRGIYKATVYTGEVNIKGKFSNLKKSIPANINPYNRMYIAMGISDIKSILKVNSFKAGENLQDVELVSGTGVSRISQLANGISGEFQDSGIYSADEIPFEINLVLRGSEGMSILPFGKENHFKISSSWNSPNFYGMLPSSREINENGFSAEWNISHLVRNYDQDFSAGLSVDLSEGKAGVNFYEGITHYRQVVRASKYGVLFIMLSLLIVYLFEISSRKITYYIQYGVVGFSLALFYLLLLSLSEHLNFGYAYSISVLAVVIPNSLYIKSVTQNKKYGLGMLVFLSGVYAVLYSILQMEEYALVTGTALIMTVLYVMMYLTRNLDSFYKNETEEKN